MNQEVKRLHPHKFMLWVAMGSIVMMFAGLTSAYIVKKSQANWLEFALPTVLWYSTITILVSSVTMHLALKSFKARQMQRYRLLIGITAVLGLVFIIFQYVGFPAYMKPFAGGGWKNVYKLTDMDDFFEKHGETNQLVMLLQEEIIFEEYYRCYCIGGKHVRIMSYEPRNPHHLRYVADFKPSKERLQQMEEIVLRINKYLGYDFNTVELALRDGVPYAIDFCNPAPDADIKSVGQENFDWVVETAANYAIEKAQQQVDGADNLTWGEYIKTGATGQKLY